MWAIELTERHFMAEILTFPARRRNALPAAGPHAPSAPAAILFFTGVRYERAADTATDEPGAARTNPDPKKPRGRRRA